MSAFAFILYSAAELNLHTWKRPVPVAGATVKNHCPSSLVRGTEVVRLGRDRFS